MVLAFVVGICVVWCALFHSPAVAAIARATQGLVHPTLLAACVTAVCVTTTAWAAGLSLSDFGIDKRNVRGGLAAWLAAYGGVQLLLLTAALLGGWGVHYASLPTVVMGSAIAQLLGNALVEEASFRGLLFRQVLARARGIPTAAAIAAIPFALAHIPQRLSTGTTGTDLGMSLFELWLMGLLATYLYLRSANLLVVVALHATFNAQPLVASPLNLRGAYCVVLLITVVTLGIRARCRR